MTATPYLFLQLLLCGILWIEFGNSKHNKSVLAFQPKSVSHQHRRLEYRNIRNRETTNANHRATAIQSSGTMEENPEGNATKKLKLDARKKLFKIRTITAFITFCESDFDKDGESVKEKIGYAAKALESLKDPMEENGYEVQTVRIATNPFPEYILGAAWPTTTSIDVSDVEKRLKLMDDCFEQHGIAFVSLGTAHCPITTKICTQIVGFGKGRFSASVHLPSNDVALAKVAAETVLENSKLGNPEDGGLANFRFCVSNLGPYVPFFPGGKAAKHDSSEPFRIRFAIGLENGGLLKDLLAHDADRTIAKILAPTNDGIADTTTTTSSFATGFANTVRPLQEICERVVDERDKNLSTLEYLGLDASFNPSLDDEGSVAGAMEILEEVRGDFGGVGTIAATAAMTKAIQTKLVSSDGTNIKLTGYNGLMLPLCEDKRLATLASDGKLKIKDLLNISSVCGVGIDTVPVPGNADVNELASLYLDVAGLAERWNKPLSCRVFPVPNKQVGDKTTFDSPFLVNSNILPISG